MTLVFHMLVNCVQWSHVSEHWCRFCQVSIILVLPLKSSPPDFNPWRQFQKSYSESILNWLTILQKQIIGIFTNHFRLNWENVVKMSGHWWDGSSDWDGKVPWAISIWEWGIELSIPEPVFLKSQWLQDPGLPSASLTGPLDISKILLLWPLVPKVLSLWTLYKTEMMLQFVQIMNLTIISLPWNGISGASYFGSFCVYIFGKTLILSKNFEL